MNKRLWMVMILALGLVLLTAGMAGAAAKFQDLTGTWTGTANTAYWEGGNYNFESVGVTLVVSQQDANGMFYGTFTYDTSEDIMTGSIATNKIITIASWISGGHGTFTGKLTGKTITGTVNFFYDAYIATETVKLTKQ